MIQKAVHVKAKADLRSSTIDRNLDVCCPKDYCLSDNTFLKL